MYLIVFTRFFDSDFESHQLNVFHDYDSAYSFFCKLKRHEDYKIHYFISVKEDFINGLKYI